MTANARKLEWSKWPVLGQWKIDENHPVFAGHFPDHPVMPGALLLSWLIGDVRRLTGRETVEIREARFQGAALPGFALESRITVVANTIRFAIVTTGAQARVIASGTLMMLGDTAL